MAFVAGQRTAFRRSVPVVLERVGRQIHVAVALVAAGIPVAGQVHVVAQDAGVLLAAPHLVLFVQQRRSEAVQVAVDPERITTARATDRGWIHAAARGRFGSDQRKADRGGNDEHQRVHGAGSHHRHAQPGGAHLVEFRQRVRISLRISRPFLPHLEPLDNVEKHQNRYRNNPGSDHHFPPRGPIERFPPARVRQPTDVDPVQHHSENTQPGDCPLTAAAASHRGDE